MPIVVETLEQAAMVEMIRLDRKLWLNAAKDRVIEDTTPMDPEAAFLYGDVGHLVPKHEAKKLGALPLEKPEKQARKPAAKTAEKPTTEEQGV
jgi:hypothetical protein